MISEQLQKQNLKNGFFLSGGFRVLFLIFFAAASHLVNFLVYPFPKRDALTYLHILQYWNQTGSLAQVLEKFPKFGLLLFHFLPLKWAEQAGVPIFPASVVWMIFLSAVSVWAFYKIVLLLTNDVSKAMWCGILLSVHPMPLLFAGCLMRDTPYLASCLLSVLCLICSVRERKWYFFLLSGVTLAMSVLSRFEAWELFVLFPVLTVFYMIRNRFSRREVLLLTLCAAAGFLLTLSLMLMLVGDLPLLYGKARPVVQFYLRNWVRF